MSEQIEPRSKKERMAYVEGYLHALLDAQEHGMLCARDWGLQMASLEGYGQPKEKTDV